MPILMVPRTRQPLTPPQINWDNALTRGLVFCGLSFADTYIDLVTNQQVSRTGTIDKVSYPTAQTSPPTVGPFRALKPAASGYLSFARTTGLDLLTTQGTILAIGYHNGGTDGNMQYVLASFESATNYAGCGLGIDNYNQFTAAGVGIYVRSSATGPTWFATPTAVLVQPEQNLAHIIGGAWDGALGYCYYGGTTRISGTLALTANLTAGRVTYVNRGNNDAGGQAGNVLALAFNRVLSQEEYKQWARNPWQVLAPIPRIVPAFEVSAPAGGGGPLVGGLVRPSLTEGRLVA